MLVDIVHMKRNEILLFTGLQSLLPVLFRGEAFFHTPLSPTEFCKAADASLSATETTRMVFVQTFLFPLFANYNPWRLLNWWAW